ncbi:hypothetical protein FEM48_Zijuj12G0139200 [Ziziphus jujuba var. spinosa]|uniref:Fe2OG dioxygenase domain-containing protein n=1 Tax=Ziziphus jujuba var. spinosa TaxID=714518 RepID=A0A978UDQ7_ZIZJJ|nr:hypothetical protein FEM48_Zijuj12G0139200 [Ziziphus jujuba var. spinosa]
MENQMIDSAQTAKFSALNCIDLSSPDIHHSVSLLKQACLDCGFFYVVNHGISQEFMDNVFAQSKRFFNLPESEKMKILRNEKHRGYTPVLDEHLDPENQVHGLLFFLVFLSFHLSFITISVSGFFVFFFPYFLICEIGDYKEGYYIGVEVPKDEIEAEKPFYGPNVWPEPDTLPGWRETMEKFHQEALQVARAVARIIALALDLDIDFFDKPQMLGEPIATLRLLHYGGHTSDPSKGLFGAGAHSDYGLITLLATDEVLGLQICKDKDAKPQKWEYVSPLKGAFIVNLGDMLERWSNCIFKSTLHRVLGNGQERYSIAYFVEPSHECLVECLPTCKSEKNPPKFPPILCRDYLSQRYMDTHADLNTYSKH